MLTASRTRSTCLKNQFFSLCEAAEQDRRQSRRQRQSVEGGNRDGEGNGESELAEQDASGAGEKCDRHKHGHQHQRGGDDGAGNFPHGVRGGLGRAGLASLEVALDVFNHDDHVVDDQPRRQSDAKKSQRVNRKTKQLDESKCPDERNGSGDEVNDRRPPVAEENEDHENDEQDRGTNRKNHVADGFAHGIGGVEGDFIFHAGRKTLGQAIEFRDATLMNIERVGGGELGDGDADCVTPVVVEVGAVVFGAEFGVAHIFETDERAIGITLEDDVIELCGLGETPNGAHADLELLAGDGGLGADLSGGDFDVLFLEGVDGIVGGEGAAGHAHRVKPEAHGILALAEDEDVGDAGHALERVAHIHVEIVADEDRGKTAVGREDGAAEDEVLRGLGDGDADLLDGGGEPPGGGVHAVFDIDGGQVGIAVEIEGRRDGADAVVGAGRGDVLHPLGAVDLLFERRGDGGFDRLGTGSGVYGRNANLRGSEIGELCDGECGNAGRAGENNEQRADGGKYRTMNEEINHRKAVLSRQFSVVSSQSSVLSRQFSVVSLP